MSEKLSRSKKPIKITYIKTPGDPVERIIEVITPIINRVLREYGATLTKDLGDILREHASEIQSQNNSTNTQ